MLGTPVSVAGVFRESEVLATTRTAGGTKRATAQFSGMTEVVLRLAYFYVNEPIADLDNIVKPIQDALKGHRVR